MIGWIFNASPLILLGRIDQLELVEALEPNFRIPTAVIDEILAGKVKDPAANWLTEHCPSDHIVDAPPPPPFLGQWDLGTGETAVLSLALENKGAAVVLDDKAARKFATTFHIPLLGTLGVLIRAKKAGLIDCIATYIQALDDAGASLSQAVIEAALRLAGDS